MLRTLALISVCIAPLPALAQNPPGYLVADTVTVQSETLLIATGNVVITHGARRIETSKITFDTVTGMIEVNSPLRLTEGDDTIILADAGALDTELQTGLLTTARTLVNDQLQMTAARLSFHDSGLRYSDKAAVTSCQTCAGGIPTWEIRARRVIHDPETRRIYLNHARLHLLGVPVLYLPRLRFPEPSVKRATGFLVPQIWQSTLLGTGVSLPYFVTLGDHKDVTLTPRISDETRALEYNYRQAFAKGDVRLNGAVSSDDFSDDPIRAYVFGTGTFALQNDFKLNVQARASSDDTYLSEYDFSGTSRLESFAAVTRFTRREATEFRTTYFKNLRPNAANSTEPSLLLEAVQDWRFPYDPLGGTFDLGAKFLGTYRASDRATDGADTDTEVDGFDLSVFHLSGGYTQNWAMASGLLVGTKLGGEVDQYLIRQYEALPNTIDRARATAIFDLSYPVGRRAAGGAVDTVTPRVAYIQKTRTNTDVPNQDSTRVEFDQGNIFALEYAPGLDVHEQGNRVATTVQWDRLYPSGGSFMVNAGRAFRSEDAAPYATTSGLSDPNSDWLLGFNLHRPSGFALLSRGVMDTEGTFQKAEMRAGYSDTTRSINLTYNHLLPDEQEGRTDEVNYVGLSASHKLGRDWKVGAKIRRDIVLEEPFSAGMSAAYETQCIVVDFSASRRFTLNADVEDITDYAITVDLKTYDPRRRRSCGG